MPSESKPKLRNRAELSLFLKYCKERFNVKDGKWCSLALPSQPRFLTAKELLDGYLQQREWLAKNDEDYQKFRGVKFCEYFQL